VAEINQVLDYAKIKKIYQDTPVHKQDLVEQVLKIAKFAQVFSKVEVINEHAADNKFLECASASKADYIVSGDKHVLNVSSYKKTKILTVNDFLKEI
jgi:uncharacterized protein